MNRIEKNKVLNLFKKCCCFYKVNDRCYKLETSVVVSDDKMIDLLKKFFTEEE